MTAREYWKAVYQRFDPEATPNTPAWRVERPYSPAKEIAKKMRSGLDNPRVLLVGTRGTGKTTELYRVVDELRPGDLAIYLDVHQHLQDRVGDAAAVDSIHPWEVIELVALATLRAGREMLGQDALQDAAGLLGAAIKALHPENQAEIDVGKLAGAMVVGVTSALNAPIPAFELLKAAATAASWKLPIGRRTQAADDQDDRVRRLIESCNRLFEDIEAGGRRPVLLLDGLDRITNTETAEGIFVRSSLLGQLRSRAMVVVGPISLRRGHLSRVRGLRPLVVTEVPVMDQEDPAQPGAGVSFFMDVWQRRTAELGASRLPEAVIRAAAYYSGGRPRSFQRIIRDLAEEAFAAEQGELPDGALDQVLRVVRRELEEGITRGDIAFLQAVMSDPAHLPEEGPKLGDLLERLLLLPYPNDNTWYFPNPLLRLGRLLGPSASVAS